MKEAGIAASWWANTLRRSHQDFSSGDATLSYLAALLSSRATPLDPQTIDHFEDALSRSLRDQIGRQSGPSNGFFSLTLATAFHPDALMQDCCFAAGFAPRMTLFPWCTEMTIKPGEIYVNEGAEGKTVFLLDENAIRTKPKEKHKRRHFNF